MVRNKSISFVTSILLIFISACGPKPAPVVDPSTDQDSTAVINTRVAEIVAATDAAQTVIANNMTATAAAQTAIANAVASTLAAMVTSTPEFTFTPSLTPSPTFTLTSQVPTISVSVQTNCRVGPGTVYEIRGMLNVGETAQVMGRNAETDNWIIKLPSNPVVTCWVWGKYATVVGNITGLPNITPPPTPTPRASPTVSPDFLLTYDSVPYCAAWVEWYIVFKVINTGGLTWESNQLAVTDGNIPVTITVVSNDFSTRNKCASNPSSNNLGPGQTAIISSGHFDVNPSGHHFSATIKVCSSEDVSGTCLSKTISFTP